MKENTALATIEQFNIPDAAADVTTYDAEEFEDIAPDFPRVKIPSGGALSFEILNPDDPDDPVVSKTLAGVIVLQHTANSYWEGSDPTGAPPDCVSKDGVFGRGNPGGQCQNCPLNEFGSGEGGKGKACKNMKCIYLLRDGDIMPLVLSLPPTSLRAFRSYSNNLRFAGRGLSSVKTVIGLKREDGASGPYSVATFKNGGVLTEELQQRSRKYARAMRAQYDAQKLTGDVPAADYNTGGTDTPPNIDPETGEISQF